MFNVSQFIKKLEDVLVENDVKLKIIFGSDDISNRFYDEFGRVPLVNTEVITFPMFWAYYAYTNLFYKNKYSIHGDTGLVNIGLDDSSKKYHIEKLFISLNNKAHHHRCEFMDLLCKRNLLEHGNVSWLNPYPILDYQFKYWEPVKLTFNDNYENTLDSYEHIPPEYKQSA